MKLLFFSNTLQGGGAERVLVNLTTELAHRGHDITIALNFNRSNYEVDSHVKILAAPQKEWYIGRNLVLRLFRNFAMSRFYSRHTRSAISEVKPDIIITFLQCNIRAIIRYHGDIPIVHSEHNAYDRKLGLRNYYNRFYLNKNFDKVCVLTPFDKGYATAKGLKNTIVMPNPNTFDAITEEMYDDLYPLRKNILLCGRVRQWYVKGFDLAIQAFAEKSAKMPEIEMDVVGEYDEQSKEQLMNLASSLGVSDKVHFLGQRSDIRELMQNYKLFVLSSRTEGFPMVVTEAMTQGLPCIAFERLASTIIIENQDGILVKNEDIHSLSLAIFRLINNDDCRYWLGRNAIKNVQRFSSTYVSERWEQLFKEIMYI